MKKSMSVILLSLFCFMSLPLLAASIQKAEMLTENGLIQDAKRELIDILFGEAEGDVKAHALYLLNKIATEEGKTELAQKYRTQLEQEYPDSRYYKLIKEDEDNQSASASKKATVDKDEAPDVSGDEEIALEKAFEVAKKYRITDRINISVIKNRIIYDLPIDKASLQDIGVLQDPSKPDKKYQFTHWFVDQEKSLIDDSTNVILKLYANEETTGIFGTAKRPVLIIRCAENKTSAYIYTDSVLGSTEATIRLGSKPAFIQSMNKSTDSQALFFDAPISKIKQFWNFDKMLVRYLPYGSGYKTITFNISGLKYMIKPLRKSCNW